MKKLTKEFNAITVSRNEKFTVELPGMPSAGYLWDVQTPSGNILLLGSKGEAPDTKMIGGGVTQIFTFFAAAPGEAEIKAVYRRPWENTAEETCVFKVSVK